MQEEKTIFEDRLHELTGLSKAKRDELAEKVMVAQGSKVIGRWLFLYWNNYCKSYNVTIGKFSFTVEIG